MVDPEGMKPELQTTEEKVAALEDLVKRQQQALEAAADQMRLQQDLLKTQGEQIVDLQKTSLALEQRIDIITNFPQHPGLYVQLDKIVLAAQTPAEAMQQIQKNAEFGSLQSRVADAIRDQLRGDSTISEDERSQIEFAAEASDVIKAVMDNAFDYFEPNEMTEATDHWEISTEILATMREQLNNKVSRIKSRIADVKRK